MLHGSQKGAGIIAVFGVQSCERRCSLCDVKARHLMCSPAFGSRVQAERALDVFLDGQCYGDGFLSVQICNI